MRSNSIKGIGQALVIVVMLLSLWTLATAETGTVEIETSEQALDRALEYAGFDQMKRFARPSAAASTVTTSVIDTVTPFLSEQISGEDRWVVTFDSVYLEMDSVWSELNHARQLKKTYRFYIDPETGRLLKIVGRHDWENSDMPMLPHVSESERFFTASGNTYAGFVDGPPPVSFYEALANVRFVQPLGAEEIYAWLVMDASGGMEPHPRWVIIGRGTPPIPVFGVSRPTSIDADEQSSLTCYMCKVDAVSGKALGCRSVSPFEPGAPE